MRRTAIALLVAAVAVTGLPAVAGGPQGTGLVTIYDDDFGVPHVVAETEEAMAFGAGYVVARDRLFETDVIRRLGQGRLSEILGSGMLEADQVTRREFYDRADIRRQVAGLPARVKRLLQAYADGFNVALAEQTADPTKMSVLFPALAYVPEPWTMEDSATVLMLFTAVTFAGEGAGGELNNAQILADLVSRHDGDVDAALEVWQDLLLRNDPGARAVVADGEGPPPSFVSASSPSEPQIALALGADESVSAAAEVEASMLLALRRVAEMVPFPRIGSYAVAVDGTRTLSGGPLLLGAPQAGFTAPSTFYELGLHAPGWNCTGFTVPGLGPFIGIGWCNGHAWTLVAGNAGDQVDLVVEKLCDGGYLYEGSCRPFERRTERYLVKSTLDQQLDVVEEEILSTRHGSVFHLDADAGRAYVFRRAQAGRFVNTFQGTLALNTARTLGELEVGAQEITATYNFTYADDAGNIGYRFTGYQPVRSTLIDHRLPTPGWEARFEWQARSLPFWSMPHVTNPADGVVVVSQGVDSKPIGWWPRASDVFISRFGHTRADYETLADEDEIDTARMQQIDRMMIMDTDTLARQVEHLIDGALAGQPGRLGDAYALFDDWRDAGFPREVADGKLAHPAITIFTPDGLNFRRSGLWGRFIDRFWSERAGVPARGPFVGRLGQTLAAIEEPGLFSTIDPTDWEEDLRFALTQELDALEQRFATADMAAWLNDAPRVSFSAIGVIAPPPMQVIDHGTYSQIVDLGAGVGGNVLPPGNGRADTALQVGANAATGGFPRHFTDQIELYETFQLKPMKMRPEQYTAGAEVTRLIYPGVILLR